MYKIVRQFKAREWNRTRVIRTGLTLEQAQAWCRDPETSSSTCKGWHKRKYSEVVGPWFDGYEEVATARRHLSFARSW